MSSVVSFVIPVLNERETIATLLGELRQSFPESELIVVDGGSKDDSVAQAMPHCDQLLVSDAGRATQMNLGGRVASADYIFFLHADTRPTIDDTRLQRYVADAPQWGFSLVRLSGEGAAYRIIERCINSRSRLTSVATGDQMLFLRRDLFAATCGFDPLPLMEDVAYCKRLRRHSRPVILDDVVVTSSRRWEEGGVVRTVVRMWALRLAYFLGVPPRNLWRYYYGQ